MRAVCFEAPNEVVVRDVPEPDPGPGEALVAPRYVGLCGTDLELLEGTMPYFAQGVAAYPLQPGHEVAGVVVEAPGGTVEVGTPVMLDPIVGCGACEDCRAGRTALCPRHRALGIRLGMPGGAAELVAVPVVNLRPLPVGLPLRDAVLAEPGATALNGVLAVEPAAGMRALVVGAGTLGAIAVQLLRTRGVEVDALIVDPQRRAFVERLGARAVERVEPGAYDAVLEYAGSPGAVHAAIAAVAPGGRIALAGVQPGPVDGVAVNDVVLRGVTIAGITISDRFAAVLDELASGAVAAESLIDRVYELEEAREAFARLADASRERPKVLLGVGGGDGPPRREQGVDR